MHLSSFCLRRGKRYSAGYTSPTVQRSVGVMVWAAMNSRGCICLRRCPDKIDAPAYQAILGTALPFIKPSRIRRVFQQDGAPPHTASIAIPLQFCPGSTQRWLATNSIRQLNAGVWPPMSPDLNPVEHLWPLVLRNIGHKVFNSKEDLWSELQRAFSEISPTAIRKLYSSMSRRIVAVIRARGHHTKY